MAFWYRVKQSQLRSLSNQLKRQYFQIHEPSSINHTTSNARICGQTKPNSFLHNTQFEFCNSVRFFAAPVQVKPKQEEKDDGPRLNGQITAQFIRLVTDEGHSVVPRHEALERARRLKLDLVEVQRTAKPPVCKLMDYHKEKYQQQLKDKDRTKSKSEVTLRKGDCKEVRVEGKIEQKDLQMKADMVKRLMDKGYRVKCTARGNDKKAMANEDQKLGELLARFYALIADVSIVESGPLVEKKMAYVIVRHVKFGPSKKGSKNASTADAISSQVQKLADAAQEVNTVSQNPIQFEGNDASNDFEQDLDVDEVTENTNHKQMEAPPFMGSTKPVPESTSARGPYPSEAPPPTENRYKRTPPSNEANFKGPDPRRSQPQFPNQGRQHQLPNEGRQPQFPSQGRQQQFDSRGEFPSNAPNSPGQCYGMFNASKVSTSTKAPSVLTEVNRYKKTVNPNSFVPNSRGSRRPDGDKGGHDRR